MKLNWTCQHRTHYHDYFFEHLAADRDIDLTVHFVRPVLPSHPWTGSARASYCHRFYDLRQKVDMTLLRSVFDADSILIVAGWQDVTAQAAVTLAALSGRPFALWTDTPQPAKRNPPKAVLRGGFLRFAFRFSRFVAGTGPVALNRLAQMGCAPAKLVNLPFFVDLSTFRPIERTDRGTGPFTLLSAGRLLNGVKGHDVAMRAVSLAQQRVDRPLQYRIAGVGEDLAKLRSLSATLGVDVDFVGWLEPHDLPPFFATGDLLLHPSHRDPYPNVVLEALASGVPVLASDACGNAYERVGVPAAGFVHPAGDYEVLADQIVRLVQNETLRGRMSVEARRSAEQWPVQRGITIIKRALGLSPHQPL